jgi:D-sedoheptulose 7-phosphate isomerase
VIKEIERHIDNHLATIEALRPQLPIIEQIGDLMSERLEAGGCIFWMGNGGSAADCQHLAAELVGRFERERSGIASLALTADTSVLTSVANDYGFETIFSRQVEALCGPQDLLIAISTSGNSPNVLNAIETARARGVRSVGLTGRDGGRLGELVDIALIASSDNTARIQEAHILIGHILCDLAEHRICQKPPNGR